VLVKLPFVSPEEPLHRAALRSLESHGTDGMFNYLVPLAAETSNHWIDSLVRGPIMESGDAGRYPGAVILLDPRAATNEWGDDLVSSLIAQPVSRLSFREMIVKLREMAQGTKIINSSSS
jgi:Rad3-related DNA helicase